MNEGNELYLGRGSSFPKNSKKRHGWRGAVGTDSPTAKGGVAAPAAAGLPAALPVPLPWPLVVFSSLRLRS